MFPCEVPSNVVTVTSRNNDEVYSCLPEYPTPGSTLTVTTNYSTTITNNFNANLFPEILSMGYSSSISAGNSLGWSKKIIRPLIYNW